MNKHKISGLFASRTGIIIAGALIGLVAALLQWAGNPANMGFCTACFLRDLAGGLGLHRVATLSYPRPEIPGVMLGALIAALLSGERVDRGGSSPLVRVALGFWAAVGSLAFLGCPWRALLRLAGGDGNALTGLAGLVAGCALGVFLLKSGFHLGRAVRLAGRGGWVAPLGALVLVGLLLMPGAAGAGRAPFLSTAGPGAARAAVAVSLAGGLLIGFLAQRSRFCTMGAFRDIFLTGDAHLLRGVAVLTAVVLVFNLATGAFRPGFAGQPLAHDGHLWNFLGLTLGGLAFVMAGGCPGRQLVMAGEGNADSAIFIAGMIVGAALVHNFELAAGPAGLPPPGAVLVLAGFVFCLFIGLTHREKLT